MANNIEELYNNLIVTNNDNEGQENIDLNALNFCDPDNNIINYDMFYPHRPDNINVISDIINNPAVVNLLDGTRGISTAISNIGLSTKDKNNIIDNIKEILPADKIQDLLQACEDNIEYPINNYVIIEFGDDYTLGDAVEYTLDVSAGDVINSKTILGSVVQNGETLPIKSIFCNAEIMSNSNGDFYHLFPSVANRHIVLTNVTYGGESEELDFDIINQYATEFSENSYLYTLILNNLVYSVLPEILTHRESKSSHYFFSLGFGWFTHICPYSSGQTIYSDYIKNYENNGLGNLRNELVDLCSAQSIKATLGSSEKLLLLANKILKKREEILLWIISYYNNASNLDICRYDENYNDCRNLAQGVNNDLTSTKIGNITYTNYYLYLLSKIQIIDGDEWSKKYYNLLAELIEHRLSIEKYSIDYLISEFNQIFLKSITTLFENPYITINKNITITEDTTLATLFASMQTYITDTLGITMATASSSLASAIYQITNLFWFIKNYHGENLEMSLNSETWDIMNLITYERNKLYNFWQEALDAYFNKTDINSTINKLTEFANSPKKYAEWPSALEFTIEGITYKLYEFQNPINLPETPEETKEVFTDDDLNPNPSDPTNIPIQDASLYYAANQSDNDPTEDEITLKDFAYWVKYFALATIISLPYLSDGLDIPTTNGLVPIPMPGIYICLGVIYIKDLDLVIVIGLALRGIWPAPIVIGVNLSSKYLSITTTPLVVMLKKIKEMYDSIIKNIEMTIPNLVLIIINKLETENAKYRKKNEELKIYQEVLKAQRVEDKALLKNQLKEAYKGKMFDTRQIYTRLEDLSAAATATYNEATSSLSNDNSDAE